MFSIQPAYFVAVFASKECMDVQQSNGEGAKLPTIENSSGPVESKTANPIDTLLSYVADSDGLIDRYIFLKIS